MFVLSARFAALLVFCGIAICPLSSDVSAGVHAAAIARDAPRTMGTASDDKQAFFSHSPHANEHSSIKHKVRTIDYPFGPAFVNGLLTHLQYTRGLEGNRHKHESIVIPNGRGSKHVGKYSRRGATTPQWVASPGNQTSINSTSVPDAAETKTNLTEIVGIVKLMSGIEEGAKGIAFLEIGNSNGTEVLQAVSTEADASPMSLTSFDPSAGTRQGADKDNNVVYLCATDDRGCATFDESDLYKQNIQLQPKGIASSKPNFSQSFLFNPETRQLTPLSNAKTGGTPTYNDTSSPSSMDANSTTSPGVQPHASGVSRRAQSFGQMQNVTLIFEPKGSNKTEIVNAKEVASTSTVTQTVTLYSTALTSATSSSQPVPTDGGSGMNVELVGVPASSDNHTSVASSSFSGLANAAATSSKATSASTTPLGRFAAASVTAISSASSSVNPSVIAASLASSYSNALRSSVSNAASSSAFVAASVSETNSATSSAQPAVQSFIAAVAWRRDAAPAMETLNTAPYAWMFSPESR